MPDSGYSGTPLARKLGIKEGARVGLVGAPQGFERLLAGRPDSSALVRGPRARVDLLVWFVASREALVRGLSRRAALAGLDAPARKGEARASGAGGVKGGLWIAWPKRASGVATDLTEDVIREVVLPTGLVDIKVCAIDATWSGLRLARRRA